MLRAVPLLSTVALLLTLAASARGAPSPEEERLFSQGAQAFDAGDARGAGEAAGRALEILHAFPGALYTQARAAAHLGDGAGAEEARARLTVLAATDGDARDLLAALAGPPTSATRRPEGTP